MTLSAQLHSNRHSARDHALDDHWVIPFSLWCQLNNFSPATGRRLRKAGKGPVFTQISDRRIGVTVRNNRIWHQSRALDESESAQCAPSPTASKRKCPGSSRFAP